MGNRQKKKCKKCEATVEIEGFDYCRVCNKKESNQIAVVNRHHGNEDLSKTVNFGNRLKD